jgi:hypothetical protein
LQVHHIKPLAEGGDKYDLENLATLCQKCHAMVGRGGHPIVGNPPLHPSPGIRETNSRSRNENENGIGAGPDNDIEPLVG